MRALQTLPAGDQLAAPLARVLRANFAAWAETVPALEHVWDDRTGSEGKPGSQPRMVASPDGERVAFAVGPDAVEGFRTDRGHPVGPPVTSPGLGSAIAIVTDGASLWVEVAAVRPRGPSTRSTPRPAGRSGR